MSDGTPAAGGTASVLRAATTETRLSALTRPDGRMVVRASAWTADTAEEAAALAVREGRPVLVSLANRDDDARAVLVSAGFAVARREAVVAFEVGGALAALAGAKLPAGVAPRSAAEVDEDALRLLDDELRQDVPGASGWRSTPEEFREQTFADPAFDPRTYLVAVDASGALAGLVRVWMNLTGPRLGLAGVRRAHRRRGVASALLAQALRAVAATGAVDVTAEYDVTNRASEALATKLGARRLGTTLELVYDPGEAADAR